ncbi:unnamed protein product [Lampetra fluviatilis]
MVSVQLGPVVGGCAVGDARDRDFDSRSRCTDIAGKERRSGRNVRKHDGRHYTGTMHLLARIALLLSLMFTMTSVVANVAKTNSSVAQPKRKRAYIHHTGEAFP